MWSADTAHDATTGGRRLKCLATLDEHTREGLAMLYGCYGISVHSVVPGMFEE